MHPPEGGAALRVPTGQHTRLGGRTRAGHTQLSPSYTPSPHAGYPGVSGVPLGLLKAV